RRAVTVVPVDCLTKEATERAGVGFGFEPRLVGRCPVRPGKGNVEQESVTGPQERSDPREEPLFPGVEVPHRAAQQREESRRVAISPQGAGQEVPAVLEIAQDSD